MPEKTCNNRDFIEGIREGLEDFLSGNYKVFEDDDELEAYLNKKEEENVHSEIKSTSAR